MKQNKNNYVGFLLVFAGAVLLSACEKAIPYEGEEQDPKLVINAIFENDSTMKVELSRSYFFLDDLSAEESWITQGAVIQITDKTTGATSTESVPAYENVYVLPVQVIEGHQYRIQVSHSKYPTASSEAQAPTKITLTQKKEEPVVSGSNQIKVTLTWNDPAAKNYYYIKAYMHDTIQGARYNLSLYCRDVAFPDAVGEIDQEYPYDLITILDETFNGSTKSLELRYDASSANLSNTVIEFDFIHIDENVYRYYLSLSKNDNSGFTIGEPVKIYNNIQDGYGIFGGLNRYRFK